MKPLDFWNLTPYEFSIIVEGYSERQTEKRQELLYLAWHTEAFARQKRLPGLKKLLKDNGQKKKNNTLSKEELLKIAKSKNIKIPDK
jgi:hypothetical protein